MASFTIGTIDGKALTAAVVSCSTTGANSIIPAVTGQIIRVYKIFIVVTAATSVTFEDGSTALSGALPLAANGSITLDMDGTPWFQTSVGNAFQINLSAGTVTAGTVYYTASQFF